MKINLYKILVAVVSIFVLIVLIILWQKNQKNLAPVALDYKNLTYTIEGRPIKLTDGYSEVEAAPGSTLKIITRYFGNEASGDLNNDGTQDVAFLLTQETGGSGTFYYIAAALKNDTGYQPTNTIFLGDRIAPQSTNINNGELIVNYAIRKPGEPMTTDPSIGVSMYFKVEGNNLVEQVDRADFGISVDLVVNQKVKFDDGLIITLAQINDSRCKPGVMCIWEGELSLLLNVIGGNFEDLQQEVRIGTVNNKKVENNGYMFELKDATESTATIVVTKKSNSINSCYIGGCSSEICSSEEGVVSTCIYKPEYDCYKTAKCEIQNDGQCGWTQTPALTACLGK